MFYCYKSNFIAYDDVSLFPSLHHAFGGLAVPLVLAHEWGHAIQDRAQNARKPTILKELQADCFAGSWLARVAAGDATGVDLRKGELDSALAALLSFRDPVGTSPDQEGAHGSGFDRTGALQEGVDGGAERCVDYFDSPPTIVETAFDDAEDAASGGNLSAKEVIPVSVTLLNAFYAQVESAYEPRTMDQLHPYDPSTDSGNDLPKCGEKVLERDVVRNRVVYCASDDSIDYDADYLQHIYDDIGDFGVVTLLADPFAAYVQKLHGVPSDSDREQLQLEADCFTGGFARTIFDGELIVDPKTEQAESLSPGDLDETIQAFIDDTSTRGVRDLDVTFYRTFAFRDGFLNGYDACAHYEDATSG